MKNYRYFKSAFTVFFGAIVFLCASYFYLYANIDSQRLEADKSESSVPYEASPPDNSGVMLNIDGKCIFLYLDFENKSVTAVINAALLEGESTCYGYPLNHTVFCERALIGLLADSLGGIELKSGEKTLRYTGVQLEALLSEAPDTAIKAEIIAAFFEKLSQNGFPLSLITLIAENSKTTLNIPECFLWEKHLPQAAKNLNIIYGGD